MSRPFKRYVVPKTRRRAENTIEYDSQLRKLGQQLLDSYCRGWKFDIENLNNGCYGHGDRAVLDERSGGQCLAATIFAERTVSIDFRMVTERKLESEILDCILHEIAHVLAGKRAAPHGRRWVSIALEIGVSLNNVMKNLSLNALCRQLRRELANKPPQKV